MMAGIRPQKNDLMKIADFKKRSQLEVVRLQSGDKEAIHAWKIICDISRKGFQEIYDLMDVTLH